MEKRRHAEGSVFAKAEKNHKVMLRRKSSGMVDSAAVKAALVEQELAEKMIETEAVADAGDEVDIGQIGVCIIRLTAPTFQTRTVCACLRMIVLLL